MSATTLKIKKLSTTCTAPKRQTKGSVGYDLYCDGRFVVAPESSHLIGTGISIELPRGTYGRIAPRSSMALQFTSIGAGVIDPDYRGELKILFFNHSKNYVVLSHGLRVAQLIVEKVATPDIEIVEYISETARGEMGFGSTGK